MARVNEPEVRLILRETDRKDLSPFIAAATELTDELPTTLGTDRLKEIERWLAAHFTHVADGGHYTTEQIADVTFRRQIMRGDTFLDLTVYGKAARAMDTSGTLGQMGTVSRKASISVVDPLPT